MQKEVHALERSNCELQPYHISYYDHIYSENSKQESPAIMSYLKASCMKIKKEFPHVNQIYVQSDNETCYKTPKLVFYMFEIVRRNGLHIICYIHTGFQFVKGPIDGYIATAMKHISKFCAAVNDTVTPVDIVRYQRDNGSVGNSILEMVCINQRKIDEFTRGNYALIKRVSLVRNHFKVRYDNSLKHVQGFCYSKIGDGIICSLSTKVDEEEKGQHNEEVQEDEEVISKNEEDNDVVIDEAADSDD